VLDKGEAERGAVLGGDAADCDVERLAGREHLTTGGCATEFELAAGLESREFAAEIRVEAGLILREERVGGGKG